MNFILYLAHRCTFKYAFIFYVLSRFFEQINSLSRIFSMTPRERKGVRMVQISGVGDLISCRLCFYGDHGEMDGDMKMKIG